MSQLKCPFNVFVSNGEVFICDTLNDRVRKVLRNGQIVTICGNGVRGYNGDDQLATDAQLYTPRAVVVSSSNQVYISEMSGNRIRKIDQHGIISTIAGTGEAGFNGDNQLAIHAMLNYPCGLFVTEDEEVLFCDCENHRVRRIDKHGMISTIAGNGKVDHCGDHPQPAISASLAGPNSIFQYKNEIYVTQENHRIHKIDQNGILTTIAGTGRTTYYYIHTTFNGNDIPATEAILNGPHGIFVHKDEIYFSDTYNFQIRKIDLNGIISKIAGTDNASGRPFYEDGTMALDAPLNYVNGLFVDEDSQIYFAEESNHCIRKIDKNGMITTIVGTGNHGYSGDVPFDFKKYPHIGPRKKKPLIKPFPKSLFDITIHIDSE